jgi:hypothetical protein
VLSTQAAISEAASGHGSVATVPIGGTASLFSWLQSTPQACFTPWQLQPWRAGTLRIVESAPAQ